MHSNEKVYYLGRIRLIDFYGFEDKTVVADLPAAQIQPEIASAVRYVLSAGNCLPGYAASARGDTGIAALEMTEDRGGGRLTLAVCAIKNRKTGRINRFGIIRECALEDIPLFAAAAPEFLPDNASEMERMTGGGQCLRLEAYRKKVIRIFTGKTQYSESFARFLCLERECREIAAVPEDYHLLFRRLLPCRNAAVYDAFVNVDPGKEDRDGKVICREYVDELQQLIDGITSCRCRAASARAAAAAIEYQTANRELIRKQNRQEKLRQQFAETPGEAELRLELERLGSLRSLLEQAGAGVKEDDGELLAGIAGLEKKLRDHLSELLAVTVRAEEQTGLRFNAWKETVDKILRAGNREKRVGLLSVKSIWNKTGTEMARIAARKNAAELALERLIETEEELNLEIIELEGVAETEPDVRYYRDAVKMLRENGFDFMPLYQGIEWARKAGAGIRAAFEEFLGHELLATLLVAEEDYEAATAIIHKEFPGFRIAGVGEKSGASQDFLAWIGQYCDLKKSQQACFYVLEKELAADGVAVFTEQDNFTCVDFRARSWSLFGYAPSLIGAGCRRKIQVAKLRERHEEIAAVGKEIKEFQDKIRELEQNSGAIAGFIAALDKILSKIPEICRELTEIRTRLACKKETRKGNAPDVENLLKQEAVAVQKRLDGLRKMKKLESEVERAAEKCRLMRENYCEAQSGITGDNGNCDEYRDAEEAMAMAGTMSELAREKAALLKKRIAEPDIRAFWNFVYDENENCLVDSDNTTLREIAGKLEKKLAEQAPPPERDGDEERYAGLLRCLREDRERLLYVAASVNRQLEKNGIDGVRFGWELKPVGPYRRLEKFVASKRGDGNGLRRILGELTEQGELSAGALLDCRNWYNFEIKRYKTGKDGRERARSFSVSAPPPLYSYLTLLVLCCHLCAPDCLNLRLLVLENLFGDIDPALFGRLAGFAADLKLQILAAGLAENSRGYDFPMAEWQQEELFLNTV